MKVFYECPRGLDLGMASTITGEAYQGPGGGYGPPGLYVKKGSAGVRNCTNTQVENNS